MEKLELLPEGSEGLYAQSTEWNFETDGSPEELVKELFRVLVQKGGVGLAAPQVGVAKTMFVMGNFTKMFACINPKIVSLGAEKALDMEGCLSFPNLFMKVKRSTSCVVQYQNVEGKVEEREFKGFMARVFLHEFDHLMGVTFDERAGSLALKMAKDKRRKEEKKKSRKAA